MSVQESGANGGTIEARRDNWRAGVAGVLAKSTRKDPADLGPEPERLLDTPTYDGFPVRPLYTSLDGLAEPALPGHWPFTRGGDAHRDVLAGLDAHCDDEDYADLVDHLIGEMADVRRESRVVIGRLGISGVHVNNDTVYQIDDAVTDGCIRYRVPRPQLLLSGGLVAA